MANLSHFIQSSRPTLGLFIDGLFMRAAEGGTFDVLDPTSDEIVAYACAATQPDVDDAVRSARQAFDAGSWRSWTRKERARFLLNIADLVENDRDRLARIEAADTGLPLSLVQNGHLSRAIDNLRYFAAEAVRTHERAVTHDEGFVNVIVQEPLGVVAIITPWNSPLSICTLSLAASIATGNTCVVKPSELAPLSITALFRTLAALDLPPGVVNLLQGSGDVGRLLVSHPSIDGISFTGAMHSGTEVMQKASSRLARVTCELGGIAYCIVLADADLTAAVEGIMWAAYGANGAACISSSVVYVQRNIIKQLTSLLRERVSRLRIGDPLHEDTDIGPLVSAAHKERLVKQREALLRNGGIEICERDGTFDSGSRAGQFFQPSLLTVPSAEYLIEDEIQGPVTIVCPFDDPIALAHRLNAGRSGLAVYIWGDGTQSSRRLAQELRFGSVAVNSPIVRDARTPFGGFRGSGIGRVGGYEWTDFWTESKSVTMPY